MNERIKQIRKEAGLTLEKFGKRIGITAASCSTIESGKSNPSTQTIRSICREFGVNENWLRTGEGDRCIESTQISKLKHFFNDVLETAPDERSAFIAALDDLDPNLWPAVAALAREYVRNLPKAPPED